MRRITRETLENFRDYSDAVVDAILELDEEIQELREELREPINRSYAEWDDQPEPEKDGESKFGSKLGVGRLGV